MFCSIIDDILETYRILRLHLSLDDKNCNKTYETFVSYCTTQIHTYHLVPGSMSPTINHLQYYTHIILYIYMQQDFLLPKPAQKCFQSSHKPFHQLVMKLLIKKIFCIDWLNYYKTNITCYGYRYRLDFFTVQWHFLPRNPFLPTTAATMIESPNLFSIPFFNTL